MKYDDTLRWMYGKLPMYQRQGGTALKKNLDNILRLDARLGHPSRKFKSIHIGGTNGKGSVSHMLASVLQEAGYTTGLYTSPHLSDFRERIRIDGRMIHKNSVSGFISRHRDFLERYALSFFEMTVGMAFDHFARRKVDIAVVEVGLGGRLDSTNILLPELSVITHISYDHTSVLGDTLEQIAVEKAGIIKPRTPVLIGRRQPDIDKIFERTAREKNAEIYFADPEKTKHFHAELHGDYQRENVSTVVHAVDLLRRRGWKITADDISRGLMRVVRNTGFAGRWQVLGEKPLIIADTAHNEEGIAAVTAQLGRLPYEQLHMVISFVQDKDLNRILPLLPENARYYFAKADIPRGLDAKVLQRQAAKYGLKGAAYRSVAEAYKEAVSGADEKDLVFVGGSTFTVAEIV